MLLQLRFALRTVGMTLASATRRFATPRTRSRGSSTASGPLPICAEAE